MSDKVPSYRRHKQSGQAIVTLTDGFGARRDVLLGEYGTTASRAEYARVIAEWEANGRRLPAKAVGNELSINELALAYWRHAEQHYRRPDGTKTSEQNEYRMALRPLKHLYGGTPAQAFGPLALKAVRELMVTGYLHPRFGRQGGLARGVVNQRMGRVRRVFKWGVENELVPPALLAGLQAVRGLQRGRSAARETEPVSPVAAAVVAQTLRHLNRYLASLVRVQLYTGMRPGEACLMRACDIDMTGKVWLYRPQSHKTAHHGHQRVVAIGPRAQEAILPLLALDTQTYLFSPRIALDELRTDRRRMRKTPVQPSQENRRKGRPKKAPGDRYTPSSYAHAVAKACDRAFPPPEQLAKGEAETDIEWTARLTSEQKVELLRWRREHRWHPHQLRHTAATEIRREVGLDAARAVLGHRSPAITEVYAELDAGKAIEVMARLG
jgi:integrase